MTIPITRRHAVGAMASGVLLRGAPPPASRQATGVKVGEITPVSAVIWTRRTSSSSRLADGIVRKGAAPKAQPLRPDEDVKTFEGACPGADGSVRVYLEPAAGRGHRQTLAWVDLRPDTDSPTSFASTG